MTEIFFTSAFSLRSQTPSFFWSLWALLNTFIEVNKKGYKENYHLVTLISFLDAYALHSVRNQESRLDSPENNENCFSWSNSFQPSYLEDPNNHTYTLFVTKDYVWMVQLQLQLERPGPAPKQHQSAHSVMLCLGKLGFRGLGGDAAPGTWAIISASSASWTSQQRQSEDKDQSSPLYYANMASGPSSYWEPRTSYFILRVLLPFSPKVIYRSHSVF